MIRINLAKEFRPQDAPIIGLESDRSRRDLYVWLFTLGVALVIIAGWWFYRWSSLNEVEQSLAKARIEKATLDEIIKEVELFEERKTRLEQQVELIRDLKTKQRGPVDLPARVEPAFAGRGLAQNANSNRNQNPDRRRGQRQPRDCRVYSFIRAK